MRCFFSGFLLLLSACIHQVEVEVPSHAALSFAEVSVVSAARQSRPLTEQLTREISETPGLSVNPSAPFRLEVTVYEAAWTREVQISEIAGERQDNRVELGGRALAVVTLRGPDGVGARLFADATRSQEGRALPLRRSQEQIARALTRDLAQDIAEQLRQSPRLVERAIYPNAPADSAKGQLHRAVLAERSGSWGEALRHARLAMQIRPSPKIAAYVRELERQLPHSAEPESSRPTWQDSNK